MSDQESKCVQIIVNVDGQTKPRTPHRTHRPWLILNVGLKVGRLDVPTAEFELVDVDEVGIIETDNGPAQWPGPHQAINLRRLQGSPRVVINFSVLDPPALHFPHDPLRAIGIHHEDDGCPMKPVNGHRSQFMRKGVSANGRLVSLQDTNDDGRTYRFALFVYSGETLVALCDPRIINR
ncbi:MAG: hypothetical protein ACJ8GK_02240 [Luteimonas sp.]